jgi:hypothetical protein
MKHDLRKEYDPKRRHFDILPKILAGNFNPPGLYNSYGILFIYTDLHDFFERLHSLAGAGDLASIKDGILNTTLVMLEQFPYKKLRAASNLSRDY